LSNELQKLKGHHQMKGSTQINEIKEIDNQLSKGIDNPNSVSAVFKGLSESNCADPKVEI
jgi:hypothetical protein